MLRRGGACPCIAGRSAHSPSLCPGRCLGSSCVIMKHVSWYIDTKVTVGRQDAWKIRTTGNHALHSPCWGLGCSWNAPEWSNKVFHARHVVCSPAKSLSQLVSGWRGEGCLCGVLHLVSRKPRSLQTAKCVIRLDRELLAARIPCPSGVVQRVRTIQGDS
jgi:hypothetical protein